MLQGEEGFGLTCEKKILLVHVASKTETSSRDSTWSDMLPGPFLDFDMRTEKEKYVLASNLVL